MGNSGIIRDELAVEIGKVKEGVDFFNFSGGWPGSDTVEFDRVHGQLTRFYNHPKIFNFRDIKLALFKLEMKIQLSHMLEDMTSLFSVSFQLWRDDGEVVHVDDKPSLSNHVTELVIHELLECCRRVAKVKEHNG